METAIFIAVFVAVFVALRRRRRGRPASRLKGAAYDPTLLW